MITYQESSKNIKILPLSILELLISDTSQANNSDDTRPSHFTS